MFEAKDYVQASCHSSCGPKFKISVKIDVAGIILTDEEAKMIGNHCSEIHNKILNLRNKNDPENILYGEETIKELIDCFGQRAIYVEKITNEYDENSSDWLIVTTNKGRIKIGWRKRVILIDWSDSIISIASTELFPEEDVTRGNKFIHAYGYGNATKYLNLLLDN